MANQTTTTALDVRIEPRVSEDIYDHMYSSLDREVGGVLLGRFESNVVEVDASVEALAAESRQASVTFTHESWDHIYAVCDAEYPGLAIVGWYHSHPNFGIFLSDYDLFIHKSFFAGEQQIALVIDPCREREGIFGWTDGDVAELIERPTARRSSDGSSDEHVEPRAAARRSAPPGVAVGLVCLLLGGAGNAVLIDGSDPSRRPAAAQSRERLDARAAIRQLEADLAEANQRPVRPSPAPGTPRPRRHRIAPGDTLSALAERYYGRADAAWLIAGINGLTDLDALAAGDRLYIPPPALIRGIERND